MPRRLGRCCHGGVNNEATLLDCGMKNVLNSTKELGLDAATRGFLEDDVIITEHGGDAPELRLSVTRLFSWYAGDFGGKKENVIAFIRDHIADNKAAVVSKYMAGPAKAITINYKSYDWTINDVSNVQ